MRVFIGIEFENNVKEYLNEISFLIKNNVTKGNFTLKDNYHLTIKYIGEVTEKEYEIICDCIDMSCRKFDKFYISLNDLGMFNKGMSNIIWVGINDGKNDLQRLYKSLENELKFEGFIKDNQKYKPHITIAKKVNLSTDKNLINIPYFKDKILVKKVTLFLSHRVNDVLTYTPLYSCDL